MHIFVFYSSSTHSTHGKHICNPRHKTKHCGRLFLLTTKGIVRRRAPPDLALHLLWSGGQTSSSIRHKTYTLNTLRSLIGDRANDEISISNASRLLPLTVFTVGSRGRLRKWWIFLERVIYNHCQKLQKREREREGEGERKEKAVTRDVPVVAFSFFYNSCVSFVLSWRDCGVAQLSLSLLRCALAGWAPAARQGARTGCDGANHGWWLGTEAWGARVAGRGACTWWGEEGAVQEEIPLWSPVPALPDGLSSLNPLCNLHQFVHTKC